MTGVRVCVCGEYTWLISGCRLLSAVLIGTHVGRLQLSVQVWKVQDSPECFSHGISCDLNDAVVTEEKALKKFFLIFFFAEVETKLYFSESLWLTTNFPQQEQDSFTV